MIGVGWKGFGDADRSTLTRAPRDLARLITFPLRDWRLTATVVHSTLFDTAAGLILESLIDIIWSKLLWVVLEDSSAIK